MADVIEIAGKMRTLARKKACRYWRKTDWQALAEDCEIEGWIGFLKAVAKESDEWICWSEALHSMTDAVVQWLYCGLSTYRTREALKPERIPFSLWGVDLRIQPATGPSPEQIVIASDLERKIRERMIRYKNNLVLETTLDIAILDGTSRLRRGTNLGESVRVVRGRRVRQLRKITSELLEEKEACRA